MSANVEKVKSLTHRRAFRMRLFPGNEIQATDRTRNISKKPTVQFDPLKMLRCSIR